MSIVEQALKSAIDAMEYHVDQTRPIHKTQEAIEACKEALAEAEGSQEPVAVLVPAQFCNLFCEQHGVTHTCSCISQGAKTIQIPQVSTHPKQWQGLTKEERAEVFDNWTGESEWQLSKDIEQKLKEKNT